jgi:small-conductance mechanosensitive channel
MFTAVAGTVVPEVVLHLVANTRDARAIATMAHVAERIGKVVPVFFVGGAVFGLLAAWVGSMNFLAPWLIATYILFVTATVVGMIFSDPWVARLRTASTAASASGDAASAELTTVIDEPRAKVASASLMLVILVMIALMVFKPGA